MTPLVRRSYAGVRPMFVAKKQSAKSLDHFGRKQRDVNLTVATDITARQQPSEHVLVLVGNPQGNIAQRP
jgi:hypothetical protein